MGRPKGSKNKPKEFKARPIHKAILKESLDELMLDTVIDNELLCSVCGRVLWGCYQPLGNGKARHGYDSDCYPGCRTWAENYRLLPNALRHEAGDLLLLHYDKGGRA